MPVVEGIMYVHRPRVKVAKGRRFVGDENLSCFRFRFALVEEYKVDLSHQKSSK